jgi:hypothetical protein
MQKSKVPARAHPCRNLTLDPRLLSRGKHMSIVATWSMVLCYSSVALKTRHIVLVLPSHLA